MSNKQTGLFVVFEGADGAGKTTALKGVAKKLAETLGDRVVTTKEPTGGQFGKLARESIGENPLLTTGLMVADRVEHGEELRALLAAGKVVLCDRYYHSTMAYTQASAPDDPRLMEAVYRLHQHPSIVQPDVTIIFTVDPKVAQERRGGQGDAYDTDVEFQRRVSGAYKRMMSLPSAPLFLHGLDTSDAATMTPARVVDAVLAILRTRLPIADVTVQ